MSSLPGVTSISQFCLPVHLLQTQFFQFAPLSVQNVLEQNTHDHELISSCAHLHSTSFQEFTKDGDTSLDKIYASVARYSRFYNEKDSESLTSEFIENGVRSVSSSDGIHIGSEQIKESLMMDSDNSLQATVLGYKKLSESVAVAHGQWIEKDTEGNNVAFGQWVNVFDISGEQAQLIMESAGQFVN